MKEFVSVIASIVFVEGLLYVVCLGWDIPFSFSKAIGVWAGIMLIRFIKQIIFD